MKRLLISALVVGFVVASFNSGTPSASAASASAVRAYVRSCLAAGGSIDVSGALPQAGTPRGDAIAYLHLVNQRCSNGRISTLLEGSRIRRRVRNEAYSGVTYLQLAANDLIQWYSGQSRYNLREAQSEYQSGVRYSRLALHDLR
jgi:hypothetical protein